MAYVSLGTIWLNDAAALSDYRSFDYMAEMSVETSSGGQVRRYANGRLRVVSRSGVAREASLSLPNCTRAQVTWLENHLGSLLLVRDHSGRRFWGVFTSLPVTEHQYDAEADVELTLAEVSHTDEV